MSLVALQESAIAEILSAPEQGRRAAAYGFTLCNRNPRTISRIRRAFFRQLARRGYTDLQQEALWGDVRDMALLEVGSL